MAFIEPLNLQHILMNVLAGSPTIFFFISILAIATLAAIFKMPNTIFMIMIGLFVVTLSYLEGIFSALYAFIVIVTAILIFYSIGKIFK